jgi:lipoprotein signal peptidase
MALMAGALAALPVALLLSRRLEGHASPLLPLGLGLATGAALSNALDLAVRGSVVDFIPVRAGLVADLADAILVLGVMVSVAALMRTVARDGTG